ncbi:MAG: hypothetical protein WC130_03730 [Kiritimatiellia bacterium]
MSKTALKTVDTEAEDIGTGLVPIENINPLALFTEDTRKTADDLVAKIRAKAESFVPDLETEEGRKAIRKLAREVNASKNALDEMGKKLVEDAKKQVALVDAGRKHLRDAIEDIRQAVLAPHDAWVEAERVRTDALKARLETLDAMGSINPETTSADIAAQLDHAKEIYLVEGDSPFDWQDFQHLADELYAAVTSNLNAALPGIQKREAEQAELAKLRADAEARAKADEEARIQRETEERERQRQKEAEEKARQEAESRVKAEAERAAKAELEAQQAKEREQQAKADAERKATEAAEAATKAEQERQAREKSAQEAEDKRREEDKAHRAKINREALAALAKAVPGLTEQQGIAVLTAIAKGQVAHIAIKY